MFGSDMTSAALMWVVLERTGSPKYVGTMLTLSMVPGLLFLPFMGVFIDRQDRRHVAIGLDVVRALAVLSVPIAVTFFGDVWVPHLFAVTILVGFCFNVHWANATALMQELCEPGEFAAASAFFAAAIQGGTLIAGAVVGLTYEHIGVRGVMSIDFATYVVSAFCLWRLRKGRHVHVSALTPRDANPVRAFLVDLRFGLSFLRRSTVVLRIGAISVFVLAAVYGLQVVMAPLNKTILHSSAHGFGWCNGSWGLGAMVASQAGLFLVALLSERASIAGPLAIITLACAALSFTTSLPIALACFFLMGYGRGASGIPLFVRMMKEVPREIMGRVQTTIGFFGLLIRITAMEAIAFAAGDVSIRTGILFATALWLVATCFALPAWTRHEEAVAAAGN